MSGIDDFSSASQAPTQAELYAVEEADKSAEKTHCLEARTALSNQIDTETRFLVFAKNFEADFGAENLKIVAKVLQAKQLECGDTLDLTALSNEELLPFIQSEVESQIAEARQDHSNAELAQEGKNLDEANAIKKQKTAEAEAKNAALSEQVNTTLSEIGSQNLGDLKRIYQSIESGGSFVGKNNAEVQISDEVRAELLPRIQSVISTLTSLRTRYFHPEEQHLIDTAQINLAGSSTAEIYAGVFEAIDSGIADEDRKKELKNQIARDLDIPNPDIDTGGDVIRALRKTKGENPRFHGDEPLQIREGVTAQVNPDGSYSMQASLVGRGIREFDISGWPSDRVTELANFLEFYVLSEKAGISSFLEDCFDIDFAMIDDFDYAKSITIRQTIEALLGFNKGYNGRIRMGAQHSWSDRAVRKT